ncbi:hypothetical protein ACKFKG_25425 [Phormidesmis sp. 146-35]
MPNCLRCVKTRLDAPVESILSRLQKALALEPKQKDGIRLQKRYDKRQDH